MNVATDALDGLYWQRQSAFIERVWNGVDGFETVAGSLGVLTDLTSVLDNYPNAYDPMMDGRNSDGEM